MALFNIRSLMRTAACFGVASIFVACSEEKSEPLPDLPAIDLPKEVPGFYSGTLPCDDCKIRMVQMTLGEDSSVTAVQTVFKESAVVDTLKGTYVVTDSAIKVFLSGNSLNWNFKRISSGNLSYMTSAGTVYEDENGATADFIRIYKKKLAKVNQPNKEMTATDVDSSKGAVKE